MKRRARSALIGCSVCSFLAVALGAQAPTSQGPSQSFTAGTTAITVDIVVRDKHGKPVSDLSPADFELLEDGMRQDIGDMTLVADGAGTPTATRTPTEGTPPSQVTKGPSSISLTLPAPSKGWIRQVWQTPIGGLSPGTYTFRVTLRDGRSSAIREHRVEVIE